MLAARAVYHGPVARGAWPDLDMQDEDAEVVGV
jgi:hypothetical protein